MARRYKTFGEMLTDLRAEANLSVNAAVGVDSDPRHKRLINRIYAVLYADYDWPHLRMTTDRLVMAAGQRYYNAPAGIDFERIEEAVVWWNGKPTPIGSGIGFIEYSAYDSEGDDRSDPVQRYDVKSTAEGTEQLEIWPVPATADHSVQFIGTRAAPELVNSIDICLLDADTIVLFAAAEILAKAKSEDASMKLAMAKKRLKLMRARSVQPSSSAEAPSIGAGPKVSMNEGRATVNISRGS